MTGVNLEQLSVALILSCANSDTNGSAALLVSMSRDELMAVATYCAQFAVGMSRQLSSVIDDDLHAELGRYALRLASAGCPDGQNSRPSNR
ncbi:hypothetical protein [Kineosporia sp. R_H_3]|uniref:hypothetical protein n=1 Tax=Kineosporia sp. R_H_3 TaxID=1961848 RepID=UPI000B4B0E4B|nr:hypothetical protein [Kineosporia sp. R_H_3]